MNREIKFRSRHRDQWIYGYPYQNGSGWWMFTDNGQVAIEAETLGQYTGLKDVHGKEIYEGDLVRTVDNGNPLIECQIDWQPYTCGEITWIRLGFEICQPARGANDLHLYQMHDDEPAALEVIGNVHEDLYPAAPDSNSDQSGGEVVKNQSASTA